MLLKADENLAKRQWKGNKHITFLLLFTFNYQFRKGKPLLSCFFQGFHTGLWVLGSIHGAEIWIRCFGKRNTLLMGFWGGRKLIFNENDIGRFWEIETVQTLL